MIDFESLPPVSFFEEETRCAFDWLLKIRDEENHGWAWVQFIRPNEQNTAEVIRALLEYPEFWHEDTQDIVAQSAEAWLLEPQNHAKLSIDWSWVLIALISIRKNSALSTQLSDERIDGAIEVCVDRLLKSQSLDGGWSDDEYVKSTTTRTSLALWALNESAAFIDNEELGSAREKAAFWLEQAQNSDGGWGNLVSESADRVYQEATELTFDEIRYQLESNGACTGYALVALGSCDRHEKFERSFKKALDYLAKSQDELGGWPVFTEVGRREGERYTFRHFSTAWALRGLVCNKLANHQSEMIISGLNYLASLQDNNYGGWRSSPDADNYTWATCNALVTIKLVRTHLSDVKAKHFLRIVNEWWELKRNETSYCFKVGREVFAFNRSMGVLFCIVFTIMTASLTILIGQWVYSLAVPFSEEIALAAKGICTILFAVLLGLPWIVLIKSIFFKDKTGWIDSIGWVYGIITGFVLALYQFIV